MVKIYSELKTCCVSFKSCLATTCLTVSIDLQERLSFTRNSASVMRNLQQTVDKGYLISQTSSHGCYSPHGLLVLSLHNDVASLDAVDKSVTLISFDLPLLGFGERDYVVDLNYSESDNSLCLIAYGGDIILLKLDEACSKADVEILGTIDQRIVAARWSPDGEILAIMTTDTVTLLTREFATLAEISVSVEDITLSARQVSVGWGRADTQFRGRNSLRDPTLPEKVDTGELSLADSNLVDISWRGDATCFCTTQVSGGRRVIRVYSRDGQLESTSEPVDGQGECVAWKPSGSVICAVKRRVLSTNVCIFFERNGLRHGDFDLRTSDAVLAMTWNCDSTVFAVQYASYLDLWVMSNYRYYHKSRLFITTGAVVRWHGEEPLRLLVSSPEVIRDLHFRWIFTTHRISMPNDYGLVAVQDGIYLGLTPLRIANVPPPMTFRTLHFRDVARDIAIAPACDIIVVLFDTYVSIYGWNLATKPIGSPAHKYRVEIDLADHVYPLQIEIDSNDRAFVLLSDSKILEISLSNGDCNRIETLGTIRSIHGYDHGIVSQDEHGVLRCLDMYENETLSTINRLPEHCRTLQVHKSSTEGEFLIAGLSSEGKLYRGADLIAARVTSFLLIEDLLAYTTVNDLTFVSLEGLTASHECQHVQNKRNIERGSLLVATCPSTQSITLQAPRGNLETIYPRILVISGLRRLLDRKEWCGAWNMTKIHRIDTNFIYDHNPVMFTKDVDKVIEALGSSTELDIFLTGLKSEDVADSMYADLYSRTDIAAERKIHPVKQSATKINHVCDTLLNIMVDHYSTTHLSSILTAHLAKQPSDIDTALRTVTALAPEHLDGAVTHICFLADPHLLYQRSLGLYNLPLALLLAQRSQKDPREYVPFLQKVQGLSVHKQRFVLDDYLGFVEKALRSLIEVPNEWEEIVSYVQKHDLWLPALLLLKYDEVRHNQIMSMYGDYLNGVQDYAVAGYAFEMVGEHTKAMTAFQRALLWSEAIYNAGLAGLDQGEIAVDMKERLLEQSRFAEAAEICRLFLNEPDSAIKLYCQASDFSRAMQLAATKSRRDELVKPNISEAFSYTSELLSDMKDQLDKQMPRLRDVRLKRDEDPDEFFEGMHEEDTPDNVSLAGTQASTTATFFTRYTGATAITTQSKKSGKARRRQERQRAKGKKGTIWEEEYLVNSIRRLVLRLEETRISTTELLIAMVRCDMRTSASDLQANLISLISLAKSLLEETFSGILSLPPELQQTMGARPELLDFVPLKLC